MDSKPDDMMPTCSAGGPAFDSESVSASDRDTIAAIATAVGGPIAIIRVSGDRAEQIASSLWRGAHGIGEAPHRTMRLGRIAGSEGDLDGRALAVYMPGPESYTGEDIVELHCHGGLLNARLVLQELLRNGARHAEPGEFTKRAFLTGKMDLTQAEAVADVIGAHTEAALRLANRQLHGLLGRQIDSLYSEYSFLLSEVEARMDFPEEDLDWIAPGDLVERIERARSEAGRLLKSRGEGEILRHGIRLAIAGPPNVGKSSLLNAVLGRDRAIVTELPGTTRDTLEELAHIRGIPVRLTDTAGIREAEDTIEQFGIDRSFASIQTAQLILWVIDASLPFSKQRWHDSQQTGTPIILVANKVDLIEPPMDDLPDDLPRPVYVSALKGDGLDELFDTVERNVWQKPHLREPEVAVSARHAALLEESLRQAADSAECVERGSWELAAVGLRAAAAAVGKINGRTMTPDVLENIFSRFCIGK